MALLGLALTEQGVRILVADLAGFGQTDRPGGDCVWPEFLRNLLDISACRTRSGRPCARDYVARRSQSGLVR